MSADVLRAAATKLREAAEAATPGVWKTWGMSVLSDQCGDSNVEHAVGVAQGLYETGERPRTFNIDYIALANPVFGLAVADWLDDMARAMVGTSYGDLPFEHRALAVARSIVGGDE